MLGMKINRYKIVKKAISKMAKSIVARKNIEPNTRLSKDHLSSNLQEEA